MRQEDKSKVEGFLLSGTLFDVYTHCSGSAHNEDFFVVVLEQLSNLLKELELCDGCRSGQACYWLHDCDVLCCSSSRMTSCTC